MAHPERSDIRVGDIPWPTRVSEAHLGDIATYRRQGKGLGASVSLTMLEEAKSLATFLTDAQSEGTDIEGELDVLNSGFIIFSHYLKAPSLFLEADSVVWTDEPVEANLNEGEAIVWNLMVGHIQAKIMEEQGKNVDQVEEITEKIEVQREAETHLLVLHLADQLRRKVPPLEVVDIAIQAEKDRLRKTLITTEASPVAQMLGYVMEKGRLRFHQLYVAAQETGLGS